MSRHRRQLGYRRSPAKVVPWLVALPVLGGIGVGLYFLFNRARDAVVSAMRTPQDILDAVAEVDPKNNPELQRGAPPAPSPTMTWCNKAVYLICKKLGVTLPWGTYGTRANDMIAYMDAGNDGWYQIATPEQAQVEALMGRVVLATYFDLGPTRTGHLAIVLPLDGPIQIAQAGKHNFNQGSISAGFGSIRPIFYGHA